MSSYNKDEAVVEELRRLLDRGQIDLAVGQNLISLGTARLIRKNLGAPSQLSLFDVQYKPKKARRGTRVTGTNPRALGTNPRALRKRHEHQP